MPVFGYALAFIFMATAISLVDTYYGEYVYVYKCLHCSQSKGNLIPTDLRCYSYSYTALEDAGRKLSINIYSPDNITREAFIYLNYYDSKLTSGKSFLQNEDGSKHKKEQGFVKTQRHTKLHDTIPISLFCYESIMTKI